MAASWQYAKFWWGWGDRVKRLNELAADGWDLVEGNQWFGIFRR